MIIRKNYLDKIIPFIDKPLIKALIGVRRSGKTVLLTQIKQHLICNGVSESQLLFVNFESFAFKKYLDGLTLYNFVLDKYSTLKGSKIYRSYLHLQIQQYQ